VITFLALRKILLLICVASLVICFQIGCTPVSETLNPNETRNFNDNISTPTSIPSVEETSSSGKLTQEQITTLISLQKIDDYPLYTLEFRGPYQQLENSSRLNEHPAGNPLTNRNQLVWACSLFASMGDNEDHKFGRNFDWEYSPGLLLFTDPPDGYASASMVDITYLGFEAEDLGVLHELELAELTPLLDAPKWPFDGMNEAGLAIGMAAVPGGKMKTDPQKPNIGSLEIIRQVLDNSADIHEAIAIMESYNIDFRGGPDLHYLIADRSGEAALVEYFQGEMHIILNDNPWHMATNFTISSVNDPIGQCARYDRLSAEIQGTGGNLDSGSAMQLLSSVSQNNTQWSVLYNLQNGAIEVTMGRGFDRTHKFQLIP